MIGSAAAIQKGVEVAEPLWSSIPKAISPAVTAILALTLALAGYFRFLRFRTFKARMSLAINATIVRLQSSVALKIDLLVKNEGQCAVVVDPMYNHALDVFLADDAVWSVAVLGTSHEILWYDEEPHRHLAVVDEPGLRGYVVPAFSQTATASLPAVIPEPGPRQQIGVLEPGEQIRRALIVPVEPAVAYLIVLTIFACTHAGRIGRFAHRRCKSQRRAPDAWEGRLVVCDDDERTEVADG